MLIVIFIFGLLLTLIAGSMMLGLNSMFFGGFMQIVCGSLLASLFASLALSIIANACLVVITPLTNAIPFVLFLKCILAAFAQPTMTGVVLLAIMFILAISAQRIGDMIENIAILMEIHKTFLPSEEAECKQKQQQQQQLKKKKL